MNTGPRQPSVTVEAYLAAEAFAETRHEYLGGAVHAMAGGSNFHNRVASNILGSLVAGLRVKACEAFNSDTKVRIELPSQTRFYYPDVQVVCGGNSGNEHFQERPVVVVEVLSDSTRRIDQTEKKDAYLTLATLKVLILVEIREPSATVYRRGAVGGFGIENYSGADEVIPLPEIALHLPLADVYERLEF